MCEKLRNVRVFEVKFKNIGYLLSYSDFIKGNKMCGKTMKCADFESLNYKILDKNLTIVFLYREVNCVEKRWNVRILKLNFEILVLYFTIVIYIYREIKMCEKRWNVQILKVKFQKCWIRPLP